MDSQDSSNSPKISGWGTPAIGVLTRNSQSQNSMQETHTSNSRFQRPSPYNSSQRGRNVNYVHGTFNNQRQNDNPAQVGSSSSSPYQSRSHNLSSDNPFKNKGQNFSSNNPFLNKEQNIRSNSPFQIMRQNSSPGVLNSPRGHHLPQPRFQSSPVRPGGANFNLNHRTPSTNFHMPSPVGFIPSGGRGFNSRNNSYKKSQSGMSNPGGSDNIRDYISHSMLENPWKNLPAIPMQQS